MFVAQTHLQLLQQAHNAGFGDEEILTLRRDYEIVCRLYAHMMRHSGRPFSCHLVGTASVALSEGLAFVQVRAALNHAAYAVGRFPAGGRGPRRDHVAWLRDRVGAEVEALIRELHDFPMTRQAIMDKAAGPADGFSARERAIFEHRLCNEVDDGWDFGAALEVGDRWTSPHYIDALLALSDHLEMPFCAAGFRLIAEQVAASSWLTPDTHFGFGGHRQSPPRYFKNTLAAFARRLRGRPDYDY